jgi:hypothetical protein
MAMGKGGGGEGSGRGVEGEGGRDGVTLEVGSPEREREVGRRGGPQCDNQEQGAAFLKERPAERKRERTRSGISKQTPKAQTSFIRKQVKVEYQPST